MRREEKAPASAAIADSVPQLVTKALKYNLYVLNINGCSDNPSNRPRRRARRMSRFQRRRFFAAAGHVPPIGAHGKPQGVASTEGDQRIRYRGNTGKSRRSGVPFAHHLQVVSQLCHLVEFLEPRPYACQLCASRHKPA